MREPALRRTWLFGPGADAAAHAAMLASGADVLMPDLEDLTPAARRDAARHLLAPFVAGCRERGAMAAVRINALEADGPLDLAAAMAARPDAILYPMAERAAQIAALDAAIAHWEGALGLTPGGTEIVPVCETALGVVDVRAIVAASPRVRCALLGAEDLANDLHAERGPDGLELEHARRRFILDCRAARVEPIDAPFTYADPAGAAREARAARRLGYRAKSLVRPEHAAVVNEAFTPTAAALDRATALVEAFEAARARGEDRALVDGQWVEVPTYRNALRLLERGRQLARPQAEDRRAGR